MSSSGGDKTLMCRLCKVLPEKLIMESGADRIHCPSCGWEEDFDVAVRIAGEYEIRRLQDKHIRDPLRKAAAGSKHLRYIPGNRSNPLPPRFMYL